MTTKLDDSGALFADGSVQSALIRGHIDGLTLSTAGSSAIMSIAAGQATDSTNMVLMNQTATSKTTAAFAAGAGNGGLDTGAIANSTWYHFYKIVTPATFSTPAVEDVCFSLSATAPTLPAGFTKFRRIGSGKTNGSAQWTSFVQAGNYFRWLTVKADVSAAAPGTGHILRVLSVPTGVGVEVFGNVRLSAADYLYVSDPASTAEFADSIRFTFNAAAASGIAYSCRTDTSAQVRTSLNSGAATLTMTTEGWIDTRGRDA